MIEGPGYLVAVAKAYAATPSAYAYAFNNPIAFVDRDGRGTGKGGAENDNEETPTNLQECLEVAARELKRQEDFYVKEYNKRLEELNKAADDPQCDPSVNCEKMFGKK